MRTAASVTNALLSGVLLLSAAVTARADSVTLTLGATPASAVTNGTVVPVTVTATIDGTPTLTATSLTFRILAPLCTNTWNTLPLLPTETPNLFCATIPRLPTGKVEFAASCTYIDSGTLATTTVSSATNSYTVGALLENVRNQTFESGWTTSSSFPYNQSDSSTGWTGTQMRVVNYNTLLGRTPPLNNSVKAMRFENVAAAMVVSPVFSAGIGSIYFEAGLKINDTLNKNNTIIVQISTDDGLSWTDLQSFTLRSTATSSQPIDLHPVIQVNLRMPARVRIYQPSGASGQNILLDNLIVSPPPADIELAMSSDAVTPKDPITNELVTVRCNIQDYSTNAPSINRRLTLSNIWVSATGTTTNRGLLTLTNTPALPDQYAVVLPGYGAGTNRYYIRCDFDGYYYTNTVSTNTTYATTNYPIERRGPYYFSNGGQTSTNLVPTNLFSYVINTNNFRVIQWLPTNTLGFGYCATNAAITNTLRLYNAGNARMTVSDITSSESAFMVSPTNFVVLAGRTQSLSVVFLPVTNGPYAATLTVFSDKTSGTNLCALSGIGADPEGVTAPTLSGPAAGTLAQALAFSVSNASNNWGYALQYQFSCDDGWTSSWSSVTSSSRVWSALGTYQVYAQARSATNPAVCSPLSAPLDVTITNTARINLGGVTNFGIVGMNLSSNLILQITNAGPGVLTITNITITNSYFTSQTTNLVVLPNTRSNVLINFAPVAPGVFTDLVVVASDATSGTNTWRVIGTGEKVFPPALLPTNTFNTIYLTNAFTAVTTNSWTTDQVQYQFDWGDGSSSGWSNAVASGATYTNRHAWSSLVDNGLVMVRARCATHTNNISDWSAPVTVTITNAYIMGVAPSLLDFGGLVTNQSVNRTLVISNAGPAAFTVSSITCPSGFSAPYSGVVNPGATAAVTMTFSPAALGIYGGTVTVNADQSLAGTRTMLVTGFCEVVSTPVCTNTYLVGHVSDSNLFGMAATSSVSHPLEYLYDWGDGTTNSWTNSATAAHAWSATNDYSLLVRARCQAHTNILSSWSATNRVRIYDAPRFAFTTITNGQPFQVTMTATGAAPGTVSNCVYYYLPPLSSVAQPTNMSFVSGNDWQAVVQPLNPGTMQYYLQYMRDGIVLCYPALTNLSLLITNSLGSARGMTFESGWTANSSSPYNQSDSSTGWTGTQIRVVNYSTLLGRTPPLNNSINVMRLENVAGAMVVSPVFSAGIGSIYFEAGLKYNDALNKDNTLIVQVSTDGGLSWTDLQSYTLRSTATSSQPIDLHPVIQVNLRMPTRVRIYQPSACASSQNILIDNLVISPPPTDVRITELLKNPGYPSCKDPVRLRCRTDDFANLVTGNVDAPSVNRRLSVWYKHDSMANFVSTDMDATGAATYEAVIPTKDIGTVQYYFRCDFDGYYFTNSVITNTAYATASYPSERIPYSYLPDARTGTVLSSFRVMTTYPVPTTNNALSYLIRFFRSEHDYLWIQTAPTNVARRMDLVDDYTWQGTTLITGITNLSWYYYGYVPYSNNATALGTMLAWGDTNQYYLHYPPMGGYADAGAAQPLQAELTYDGLLVHRFISTNASYLVRKGVFQTFDNWPARPDYFEESIDLYGAQLYTNYFSAWSSDFYTEKPGTNMDFSVAPTFWYSTEQLIGGEILAWKAVNAKAVVEPGGNKALYLNNSTNAPGRVGTTENYGLTEGLKSLSGRARLSQNDGRYAVTGLDYSWTNAYRITNTLYVASMSPETPYVSTLFCFRPDAGSLLQPYGGFKYYELRLMQINDAQINLYLYRWNNDLTVTTIKNDFVAQTATLTGAVPIQVDIAWTNMGATNVWFSGRVYRDPSAPLFAWTNTCKDLDTTRCITNGGGVGFLCKDAALEVRALTVARGTNVTNTIVTAFTNWYLGSTYTGLTNCWAISGSGTGQVLRRIVGSTLGVYAYRGGTSRTYSEVDKYTNWFLLGSYPVTSFAYSNFVCQPKYWDKVYLETRFLGGEQPIVVDDYALTPWRAYTRGVVRSPDATLNGVKFWDWTASSQQYSWSQTDSGWLVFEGMVESAGSDPYVTLDVTRANPALEQCVSSLYLTNGLGSIAFRAQVLAGTSRYRVERSDSRFPEEWETVESFANTVADGAVDRFVPVRASGTAGRIRILQLPTGSGYYTNAVSTNSTPWITNSLWISEASSPDAILKLDNLTVRDYPPADAGTWKAYNCLIAPPLTNNQTLSRSYEGTAQPDHRTCYLNNSPTDGVLSPGSYTEANPYLQTPAVDTGIGQIAFWYRAWDSNAVQVTIQGAPSAAGPWTVITNFTVTSTNYAYFDTATSVYDPDDKLLRIYVTNALAMPATTGRLCIDNVLMAESARSSYSITDVQLFPAQPLYTNQVGVRVTIDRLIMDPVGSRVYLSYVTGTNTWGYTNWWGTGYTPTTGVTTVELTNSAPQLFVSAGNAFIPPTNVDEVVQYVVWGTCSNMAGRPIFQQTNTFVNPSWYYPVNLNSTFAAQGWSPYYYVYSCPTGSVWVNEINYYYLYSADQTNEYIEIIGPANARLGSWKVVLFDSSFVEYARCTVSNSVVLPNSYNGWGFFVWGDAGVPNVNHALPVSPATYLPRPGIVRLERSMGAWEDIVCYHNDYTAQLGSMSRYAGAKPVVSPASCSSLGLTNTAYSLVYSGSNRLDFVWSKYGQGNYTPGQRNVNQMLALCSGTSLYWYLTSIVGVHGAHNLGSYRVQLDAGVTQAVIYTADPWYRIQSFMTDGVANPAAIDTRQFVWAVTNIQQNYSNNVSFYLLPDGLNTNGAPASWLASFGQTEETPFDSDSYGVPQEYLLNQSPYVSNATARFTLEALAVTGTTVSATVRLLESTNAVDYYAQPTIYGTLYLQETTNLNGGPWSDIATQTPSSVFDTNGRKLFNVPVQTNRFFKAEIR